MPHQAGLLLRCILFQHKTSPAELLRCLSSAQYGPVLQPEEASTDPDTILGPRYSQLHSSTELPLSRPHIELALIQKPLAQVSLEAKATEVFLDPGWYGCRS